ncbi:MAG: hypothetical protein JFR38_03235 [Muribaculaceae bacterium]|nr:hypothetical protein [Muribaculaceae bacterium]
MNTVNLPVFQEIVYNILIVHKRLDLVRVENKGRSFRVTGWVEASAMCVLSEGVSYPSMERSGVDVEVNREALTLLTTERRTCRADAELLTFSCATSTDGEICRMQQTGLQSVAAFVFNVLC